MHALRRLWRPLAWGVLLGLLLVLGGSHHALADPPTPLPDINIGVGQSSDPADVVSSLKILLVLTVLSLAPSILILTTAFTRIIVVFGFLRSALSTQQMPPNQVLVGLALFLTLFVMYPTWSKVYNDAWVPYAANQISQEDALAKAGGHMKDFMLKQTREKDLALFVNLAKLPQPNTPQDVPFYVVVPAFVISELKTAFMIGFLLFIPFLVIDLVVSSTLMSMGMMFLPPTLISLPFKLLLFVMVDGWSLVAQYLVQSFAGP
jgi:flagellar biosynthetic protein FliP